jgi:indole-3-glycerol phosphate synthase
MAIDLATILDRTRASLPALRRRRQELEAAVAGGKVRPFLEPRPSRRVALIAEVKRRSPSAGPINEALDPLELARAYAGAGASAVSVLTDGPFFGGSLADLAAVAAGVPLPVLRKDFILDEVQLLEARGAGAAAALLIVRALAQQELVRLIAFASALGLAVLVEAHDRNELDRALGAGAAIVGINARDLDTFTVDTAGAWRLFAAVPAGVVAVAESGMASVADVEAAAAAGADAVLVGSALAAASDPARIAAGLAGVERHGR